MSVWFGENEILISTEIGIIMSALSNIHQPIKSQQKLEWLWLHSQIFINQSNYKSPIWIEKFVVDIDLPS